MRKPILLFLTACILTVAAAPSLAQGPAPDRPVASAQEATVEASDYFSPTEIELARAYRDRAYPLAFGAMIVSLLVVVMLGRGAGSRGLAATSRRLFKRRIPRALALVAVVTIAPALAALPFTLGSHQNARDFLLATNSPEGFLRDRALSLGFRFVILAIVALIVIGLARRLPRMWGALAIPAAAGVTIVLVLVYPVVVEPAFNDFRDADQSTRARVQELAARASVDIDEVLVADASRRTTALNAYVSGFGATKRVVLFDTLLEEAPEREVDAVVAHELAHVVNSDVLVGTVLAAGGVAVATGGLWALLSWPALRRRLGADGPGDPAVIPFLAMYLTVALLVATPAANAVSRSMEAEADRFALLLTGDASTMVDLQVRLARENLSDLDPNPIIRWAFFSHPPTLERIAIALDEGRR